jgi:hypothetical protein
MTRNRIIATLRTGIEHRFRVRIGQFDPFENRAQRFTPFAPGNLCPGRRRVIA